MVLFCLKEEHWSLHFPLYEFSPSKELFGIISLPLDLGINVRLSAHFTGRGEQDWQSPKPEHPPASQHSSCSTSARVYTHTFPSGNYSTQPNTANPRDEPLYPQFQLDRADGFRQHHSSSSTHTKCMFSPAKNPLEKTRR